jgi:hypothetical protein
MAVIGCLGYRLAEVRERILDSLRKAGLPEGWISK